MATQKAYRKGTDIEVQPGEIIKNFRGEDRVFASVARDGDAGHSAKIRTEGYWAMYASVYPGIEVR